jgi:hypothetical protein
VCSSDLAEVESKAEKLEKEGFRKYEP